MLPTKDEQERDVFLRVTADQVVSKKQPVDI